MESALIRLFGFTHIVLNCQLCKGIEITFTGTLKHYGIVTVHLLEYAHVLSLFMFLYSTASIFMCTVVSLYQHNL